MAKKVIITGASGFIGQKLSQRLIQNDFEVFALSRNPNKKEKNLPEKVTAVRWDAKTSENWWEYAEGADAIINLAGENIGSGYWTTKRKQRILESRINAGNAVTDAVRRCSGKPKRLIQASAVGYYGSAGDRILEEDSPPGDGFLSEVTEKWEEAGQNTENAGLTVAITRTGIVLGEGGGLLSRILVPFKLFVGGHMGNGENWYSWIHIEDLVRGILFLIEQQNLEGVFNFTSPNPCRAKDFFKSVGKKLKRPSWFHIPAPILRLFLSEMAEEMLLASQRVIPRKLQDSGFQFKYPDVDTALEDLLKNQ